MVLDMGTNALSHQAATNDDGTIKVRRTHRCDTDTERLRVSYESADKSWQTRVFERAKAFILVLDANIHTGHKRQATMERQVELLPSSKKPRRTRDELVRPLIQRCALRTQHKDANFKSVRMAGHVVPIPDVVVPRVSSLPQRLSFDPDLSLSDLVKNVTALRGEILGDAIGGETKRKPTSKTVTIVPSIAPTTQLKQSRRRIKAPAQITLSTSTTNNQNENEADSE
jgi:hypothetical protein